MRASIDRLIGRAALAGTVALGAVLVLTVGRLALPPLLARFGGTDPAPSPAYAAGQTVDLPPALYERASITLVLFARSTCAACQQAVPFERSLADAVRRRPAARMVVLSPLWPRETERDYARALGLPDTALAPWPQPPPRVRDAPTLLVVDRRGVVIDAWKGFGDETQQARITADVARDLDAVRDP